MRNALAIVGSGALGLTFAQRIAARMPVALVARDAARAAELHAGVEVGGTRFHPDAYSAFEPPPADWILVLVKAPQTAAAAEVAARMAPRGVLSLQNGLVVDELRAGLPGVLADQGVTFEAAYRDGARIVPAGSGETLVPPGFEDVAAMLRLAGFAARIEPAIREARLMKLLVNACINPLTAVHRVANGELAKPEYAGEVRELAREAARVLAAEGVAITEAAAIARVMDVIRATAANRSSMLQDVLAQRPTEVEYLTGALLRLAARHAIPMPAHRRLYEASYA